MPPQWNFKQQDAKDNISEGMITENSKGHTDLGGWGGEGGCSVTEVIEPLRW